MGEVVAFVVGLDELGGLVEGELEHVAVEGRGALVLVEF
jgi:hypothetical protein